MIPKSLIVTNFLWLIVNVHASYDEHMLYQHLLHNYDVLERPVPNVSAPVVVTLSVTLQQIIDVNEQDQILTINAWLNYVWKDYRLRWVPEEYDGITDVRFPNGILWKPDVLLYNSVDSKFDSSYPTNNVVYSDGTITWIPPGIFKVSCHFRIKWYPFDEQKCYLKFGSWTFDGTKIDLQSGGIDMSEYMINGEFNLYKTEIYRDVKYYLCCPEPYPSLYFYLSMKRRTLFYAFNFIIPCILITVMTILGFLVPPDAGEKISLQITVLLSVSVLLSIVSGMLPATSEDVPLLGIFFSVCMVFCTVSLLITVFVLKFHHSTPDMKRMGGFTRTVLLQWLPWILNMSRPGKPESVQKRNLPSVLFRKIEKNGTENDENGRLIDAVNNNLTNLQHLNNQSLEQRVQNCCHLLKEQPNRTDMWQKVMLLLLHQQYEQIKIITKRMDDEDESIQATNDWKFAAAVMDRVALIAFTLIFVIGSLYIFSTAPYLSAG